MAAKKADPAPEYTSREMYVGTIHFCASCPYNSSNEEYVQAHVVDHRPPPPAPVVAAEAPAESGSVEPSTSSEGEVTNGA